MKNPIERGPEASELRRDILCESAPRDETDDGATISVKDPDTMLTMIVLLLACLGLAVLAHVVV